MICVTPSPQISCGEARHGRIRVVKELLSHKSIQTTMRYLHFLEIARRAAVDKLQNEDGNLLETKWIPKPEPQLAIA